MMTARAFWLVLFAVLVWSGSAVSAEIKCTSDQSLCEVRARNLVIGDRVGAFNSKGELIAVGEVVALRGRNRRIQIQSRYGRIKSNHQFEYIEDAQAATPEKFFQLYRNQLQSGWYARPQFSSIGVGESMVGYGLSLGYDSNLTQSLYWYIETGVQTASGRASFREGDDEGLDPEQDISFFGFSGALGVLARLPVNRFLYIAGRAGVGGAHLSVSQSGTGSFARLVDDRIQDGFGPLFQLAAQLEARLTNVRYFGGLYFERLQQAGVLSLGLGVMWEVD